MRIFSLLVRTCLSCATRRRTWSNKRMQTQVWFSEVLFVTDYRTHSPYHNKVSCSLTWHKIRKTISLQSPFLLFNYYYNIQNIYPISWINYELEFLWIKVLKKDYLNNKEVLKQKLLSYVCLLLRERAPLHHKNFLCWTCFTKLSLSSVEWASDENLARKLVTNDSCLVLEIMWIVL